ncbi:E3 ubiquitin-protein ligase MARCH3-like [Diachasma alloeum]|uniref:E3 ubiquitin-protein ligase MARCH3-like n=1 Tax=Diachasma alloeum TaxID=454923 RepID=UPI0007383019|nr:E3 ubiquitin-protein ligase MARCH3-like [Diachasma alloeum]
MITNDFQGTMGAVHQPCLERWLEESNRSSCEVCGFAFDVERTPRHQPLHSLLIFIKKSPGDLQISIRPPKIDLIRCLALTTMTLAAIYIFIVAGDFYSSDNFDNFPPAKWTNYSLIFLIFLIVFSYFIWIFWTLDYQKNVWYWWWQKTSTVRMNYHRHLVDERKNLNLSYNHVISRV